MRKGEPKEEEEGMEWERELIIQNKTVRQLSGVGEREKRDGGEDKTKEKERQNIVRCGDQTWRGGKVWVGTGGVTGEGEKVSSSVASFSSKHLCSRNTAGF